MKIRQLSGFHRMLRLLAPVFSSLNPPVSSDKSLMNHSRNRESIYVPQPFDIMNVKYIYEET